MTQSQALDILKTGGNVFLTGEPGAGKTHVLNEYVEWLEDCGIVVAVTASTGIAATHIGGMTIHSWSGIGARDTLTAFDLDQLASKEKMVKRMKKAQVLVIDEVSMLDGRLLDMVDKVCRMLRGREGAFGGLQVVLVGDFFQLPPIAGRGEIAKFAFESNVWGTAHFLTCYITEQYRHEDEMLSGLLASIRKGEIEDDHYALLNEQTEIEYEDIEPTKLFTHNRDVDSVNATKLTELSGEKRVFEMESRGSKGLVAGLMKNCLSPELLELRVEAMVMCTKNNFEQGYVNGTLGRVVRFDHDSGQPVIETTSGREIKLAPSSWGVEENGKVVAEVIQIPLRLAWAITVHKSQGMSLDAAEIDLRNAFAYGQGYVALSRVRTLAGMKILGLNANSLMVNPKIIRMDERFRSESDDAEYAFTEMDTDGLLGMHENFIKVLGGSIPSEEEKISKEDRAKKRLVKESTYEQTRELIVKGLSVREIAKKRSMAQTTIWNHVEKLAGDMSITKTQIESLIPKDTDWEMIYPELRDAMDEQGIEKLKPIYEAVGEKFDYDLVRLGRILYGL